MSNRAWVTLATNDSYGLGALVLAHSLRRAGSAYPAVVLITPSVTEAMRDRLSAVFAEVVTVDVLDSGDAAHLALLQRPELGITFTKIHCWNLTQFDKCVFLDADTLVVQNCDELFERDELSAAPDVGWPDCFNSGVFVFKPSAETFSGLIKFAQERGSFDGGDQGLLNSYFSDWAHGDISKHLPFLYNVTSAAFYSYLPALKHYGQNLKIIHFIGAAKPWLQQFNWESRSVDAPEHLREMLQLWWDLFVSQVHSQLDTSMSGVAGNLARVSPDPSSLQRDALDDLSRRQGWEAGNIDYMGADSFDNIWAKISQTLNQAPASPPKEPTPPPKEIEPPQVEASEAKEPEVLPLPAEKVIEESPVAAEQPKESILAVEESNKEEISAGPVALIDASADSSVPASVDALVPMGAPAPADAPALVDVPVAADAPAPAEAPAPANAPAPGDAPAPAVAPAAAEAPAPANAPAPADSLAPVDAVAPAGAPALADATALLEVVKKPVEDISKEVIPVELSDQQAVLCPKEAESSVQDAEPSPVETSAPIKALIPEAVVSEEASIPVETADIPAESSISELPSEIPIPVVEAVLAEAKAPVVEAVIQPEEVPAPVIEASAQDVPKEESSPATSTIVVQEEKSENVPKVLEEALKEESPKVVVPEPIASEAPQVQASAVVPQPESPAAGIEVPSTPSKPAVVPAASDSPPLANTPSTEEIPTEPAAKATEEAAQETRL